jgi:peroxin-16
MSLPPTPPLSTSEEHEEASKRRSADMSKQFPPKMTGVNKMLSTLSLPKEWLNQYSNFVQKNASSVSQIESALRSLTYIIPGRFRDAEIASESLHSSIQLLSLYHDSLLLRAVSKLPGMPKIERPLNRYTKYWTAKSKMYRRIALLLQCIRYTELLWEMAAKRRGEKVRWRVVVIIEILKALCRLLLLRVTGGRMVVPPLPEREPIPEETDPGNPSPPFPDETDSAYGSGSDEHLPIKPKDWTMPRTGLTLPTLPAASSISSYLMNKVLTADDIKPATALLHKIQGGARAAEILHILRPVIYALAMSRAYSRHGSAAAKSWQPWLLGVSIELAARQLRKPHSSLSGSHSSLYSGVSPRETQLEKEEWDRRAWAMGWWVLRGAFYENVTKGALKRVTESRWVPGLVGGIVGDYAFLWEEYNFASADM